MDKPANETLTEYRNRREAAALEAANQAGADIDQAGADEPIIAATAGEDGLTSGVSGADDPPPDPFALPDLPEGYDTAAWESAQKQYLDALKAEAEGGGQDKWAALTQLGLNLMSEQPQYQGESLLSIAGRAGKEPLAALQEAQKDQKAARLSYLKANVVKYMWRYDYKGKPLEDLKKAQWYLDKLINIIHNNDLKSRQIIMEGFKEGDNNNV